MTGHYGPYSKDRQTVGHVQYPENELNSTTLSFMQESIQLRMIHKENLGLDEINFIITQLDFLISNMFSSKLPEKHLTSD